MDSLTKITKQDLEEAVANFNLQKELDQLEADRRYEDWKRGYKFSWWQKNISRVDRLPAKRAFWKIILSDNWWAHDALVRHGIWDEYFCDTLGTAGEHWRDVAKKLYASEKEDHMVSTGVLNWVMAWKNHDIQFHRESSE